MFFMFLNCWTQLAQGEALYLLFCFNSILEYLSIFYYSLGSYFWFVFFFIGPDLIFFIITLKLIYV